MYKGPKRHDLIDAPLLARFFYSLDSAVRHKIDVYVLGGTALTLLGLRKEGSKDIDISCRKGWHDFNHAIRAATGNIRAKKIFIPITRGKKEIKIYYFPRALIQVFGTGLTERKRLPEDFHRFAHKIKKIEWVMPEGGKIKKIKYDELFSNITLHTIGFADLFCTKVFGLRPRDRDDMEFMIKNKGLYFRLHKKFILERFQEFWKANKKTSKRIKEGAIKTYNEFQAKYPHHLLPLKLS